MDRNNIMDSYESSENALMDSFKAAALKVTTLYKDSLVQNRKAYASGYQQALQDLFELISTQPENGYMPVQDILQFARQKNNQLNEEMMMSSGSSSTTFNTNNNRPPNPNTCSDGEDPQLQQQKMIVNPFQIDPHAQFTFAHALPAVRNNMEWDSSTIFSENLKRRMPNELSFMGRSFNIDGNNYEPPFKRKSRREDLP
ncbi:hypothetical protein K501DRAFT_281751 [Backusella circina FSU 941]|nr:hypothetical protein K501DRAFT_281751 [Backusella circina FSU 941]